MPVRTAMLMSVILESLAPYRHLDLWALILRVDFVGALTGELFGDGVQVGNMPVGLGAFRRFVDAFKVIKARSGVGDLVREFHYLVLTQNDVSKLHVWNMLWHIVHA